MFKKILSKTIAILFIFFFGAICVADIVIAAEQSATPGPRRIVSLGQSLTEAVFTLGGEDKVVGVTTYCNKPPHAQLKDKIGSSISIDVEKIVSLKPDLVLSTPLIDPKSIEKLTRMGITVMFFPAPQNFAELCDQYLQLAELLGNAEAASVSVAEAKEEAERIKRSISGMPKPRVVAQVGTNPLWFAPRDSFINDFIEFAGGKNVLPAGNGNVGREAVLALDPEVIVITTMGMAGCEEKDSWQKFAQVSAVKNGRVYIVDSDKLCSATPESFVTTLREIIGLLHPEVKREIHDE